MASDGRVPIECACGKRFSIAPEEIINCECTIRFTAGARAVDGTFTLRIEYVETEERRIAVESHDKPPVLDAGGDS